MKAKLYRNINRASQISSFEEIIEAVHRCIKQHNLYELSKSPTVYRCRQQVGEKLGQGKLIPPIHHTNASFTVAIHSVRFT